MVHCKQLNMLLIGQQMSLLYVDTRDEGQLDRVNWITIFLGQGF